MIVPHQWYDKLTLIGTCSLDSSRLTFAVSALSTINNCYVDYSSFKVAQIFAGSPGFDCPRAASNVRYIQTQLFRHA